MVKKQPNVCKKCIDVDIEIQKINMKIAQIEQKHLDLSVQNHEISKKIQYYTEKKLIKVREQSENLEKCLICRKKIRSSQMAKHICNENENSIDCEYCSHTFESIILLRSHLNIFHDDKTYYCCKKCNKKFEMKRLLQYHIQLKCRNQINENWNIDEYIVAGTSVSNPNSQHLKRQ